ncbi:MAG TPA: hypothetical protein HPP56_07820 [Nitrospirae bacterium]|nr:hypothetical protein [Nitrospirota bacterium]
MPFAKVSQDFFYKVSYKNSTPALPILLADFSKLFSSIADFGKTMFLRHPDCPAAKTYIAPLVIFPHPLLI